MVELTVPYSLRFNRKQRCFTYSAIACAKDNPFAVMLIYLPVNSDFFLF